MAPVDQMNQPVHELLNIYSTTTYSIHLLFNYLLLPSSLLLSLLVSANTRRERERSHTEREREREDARLLMGSLIETLQKNSLLPRKPYKDDLPVSQAQEKGGAAHLIGLRKRISSFSFNIQPLSSASSEWAFRKSKSMPSIGTFAASAGSPLWRWWGWGWSWLLSRKPVFAQDLEMNEEETSTLGWQSKGSWRHILHRVRSEVRKLMQSNAASLPTTQEFKYASFSYAHNITPKLAQ